ncbi:MAG: queuosine precursor transporter [Oligoflexales bacterium]
MEMSFGNFLRKPSTVYACHVSLFAALAVLTNTVGIKLFFWNGLTLPVSVFLLPITFLLTDIVSEVYGENHAFLMVMMGFFVNLIMLGFILIGVNLPASPLYAVAQAYDQVFQPAWRLFFASMCAYLFAQALDVRLFHFWKKKTKGKHLWLRNNGSTIVSQLVDSFTVNVIFLYHNPSVFQGDFLDIMNVTLHVYVVKLALAVLDTPFCYLGVWSVRRLIHEKSAEV